jgi:hypothetical protein
VAAAGGADHPHGRSSRSRRIAGGLFVVAAVEVGTAVVLSLMLGRGFQHALDTYVVTNALMGAAFATCGVLVAGQRPRNPVGWLLLADGLGHATSAAGSRSWTSASGWAGRSASSAPW